VEVAKEITEETLIVSELAYIGVLNQRGGLHTKVVESADPIISFYSFSVKI
jgi:hypothetical protein